MNEAEALHALRMAIVRYFTKNRAYPPSLHALVPDFIPDIPRSMSGQPYYYDPRNGGVYRPLPQAQRRRGVGPMGEALTGIGMQQELNRMNQSGTNAARGRARRGVGGVADDRSQHQNRAMDELGL